MLILIMMTTITMMISRCEQVITHRLSSYGIDQYAIHIIYRVTRCLGKEDKICAGHDNYIIKVIVLFDKLSYDETQRIGALCFSQDG